MSKRKPQAKVMAAKLTEIEETQTTRRNNLVTYLVNNYRDHAAMAHVAVQMRDMMNQGIPVTYELIDFLITQQNDEAIRRMAAAATQKRRNELRANRDGYVYFIGIQGQIKIGYSVDPGARAVSLSLRETNVIAVIQAHPKMERLLHDKFAAHRIGNTEWFNDCTEIRQFIDDYAEPFTHNHRSRKQRETVRAYLAPQDAYQNLLRTIFNRN
jgi:hypothetical protein